MDSSVEIFEDIPKTVSATENGKFTKIVIGLLLFDVLFQEDQDIPELCDSQFSTC